MNIYLHYCTQYFMNGGNILVLFKYECQAYLGINCRILLKYVENISYFYKLFVIFI